MRARQWRQQRQRKTATLNCYNCISTGNIHLCKVNVSIRCYVEIAKDKNESVLSSDDRIFSVSLPCHHLFASEVIIFSHFIFLIRLYL